MSDQAFDVFRGEAGGKSKRKASESATDPPKKIPKRPTQLETRLEELHEAVASLMPFWEENDPKIFMQLDHTRKRLNALTPDMVEKFIAKGEHDYHSVALGMVIDRLLGTTTLGSQPLERTDSYQQACNHMITYARRVRECLEGQS